MPELVDNALEYAKERNWFLFPLAPGEKKPLKGTRGFKDATTSERLIERFWDNVPNANIGIATGGISGFWVLDVDGPKGLEALAKLEAQFGKLPITLEVKTPGGGRHLFFLIPAGMEIHNRQNVLVGIDVRGTGGYIVAPPSIHPNGSRYEWFDVNTPIADAPEWLLGIVIKTKPAPIAKTGHTSPWERIDTSIAAVPAVKPQHAPTANSIHSYGVTPLPDTPIIERAKKYLVECPPAIQGSAGHNALLWAFRAMVIGFELGDETAKSLLWSEYNPRCSPPWDMNKPSEKRDFERKIEEVRRTPGQKPRGWLLDEYNLRSGQNALAEIAIGESMAQGLLASQATVKSEQTERQEFPLDCFPSKLADFIKQVAMSHGVDRSFVGLPVLVVAAASIGNSRRLQLKEGWTIPPLLWGALVGQTGSNKSGPLETVKEPLISLPVMPVEGSTDSTALLTPSSDPLMGNATIEAVIARLSQSPRGVLIFRDELRGWAGGFNAYKKNGSDEQDWLELWNGKSHNFDRKTNNESIRLQYASASVLGGIQPKVLASLWGADNVYSGLVPRLLVVNPPEMVPEWDSEGISEDLQALWTEVIHKLLQLPFASFNPSNGSYVPGIIKLTPEAEKAFIPYWNECKQKLPVLDPLTRAFTAKADVMAARLALVLHCLKESLDNKDVTAPLEAETMESGIALSKWFLNEAYQVYSHLIAKFREEMIRDLVKFISAKGGEVTFRQVQHKNTTKYRTTELVKKDLGLMVAMGIGVYKGRNKFVLSQK